MKIPARKQLEKVNQQRHWWIIAGGLGVILWLYVTSGSSPIDPDRLVEGFDTSVKTTSQLILVVVKYKEELIAAGAVPVLIWIANMLRKKK